MINFIAAVIILFPSLAIAGGDANQYLLSQAKRLMSYRGEVRLPAMVPSTKEQLKNLFCKNTDCVVSAVYTRGTVYYDKRLNMDNVIDRSIILHEMVHHVQRVQMGDTYTCDVWLKKEREAYRIQALYLQQRGIDTSFVNDVTLNLKCPK